jgi:hypothetical protein
MPVIAYRAGPPVALKFVRCNDAACSGGNEAPLVIDSDPTDAFGFAPTLMFGADGFPTIAHGNATDKTLRVVDCDDPTCSGGGETATNVFDGGATDGLQGFSIARGTNGFPIVSFIIRTAEAVVLASCNDASCVGNNETLTAAFNGGVGSAALLSSAAAVGSDGLPFIAIVGTDTLRSTKCNDATCSGDNEIQSVIDDPADNLGGNVALVLGLDGLPLITYDNLTATRIKVAKCGTRSCL